jgi:5-bromo-4-chloroindolyl phosphate hydrolysis protein
MNENTKDAREANVLLASLFAAVTFVVLFLLLDFGLLWSLVLAAFAGTAGLFLFRSKRPAVAAAENSQKEALAGGRAKQRQIAALGARIRNTAVAGKVREVDAMVGKVLDTIESDPGKISQARQFLDYYLDTVVKILTIYTELESKGITHGDIQEALAKAEASLDTIRSAFENQLAKLLAGDVMDLGAELDLLQKTITMEGLGK